MLPFVLACTAAAVLVLSAPFIGEIRRAIQQQFPGQFVRIIGGLVAAAVTAGVITALMRIRDRRAARYGGIAAALILAVAYASYTRTGDPQVDAVEHFHFVEYGLITLLFYRAWRPTGDASILLLPILAGVIVGTLEEWYQWLIPARVGDVRDVFLNLVAVSCGLIFSVALEPPQTFTPALGSDSRRRVGLLTAVAIVVFAGFFQSAHLGYMVAGDGWRFRSAHTAAELETASADRTARWAGQFLARPRRFSIEDQYQTEGHTHVARRNNAWAAGDVTAAWLENAILERYFAPVLDTPSYLSKTGHRWGADHRQDAGAQAAAAAPSGIYESTANPSAIHVWSKPIYWSIVVAAALIAAAPWLRASRAVTRAADSSAERTARHPAAR
jgi:VanZ family protein